MKTVEIKLYQFAELSEEAKEKALNSLYDLNVDYDWWAFIYDDAERVGVRILGFDIDRGGYCKAEFIESAEECAFKIAKNHGEACETHVAAKKYLSDRADLVLKYSDGVETDRVSEDNERAFDDDCDELDKEFLSFLQEDYRILLSKEYDYRTSKECIIETIECNEYDFTEEGKLY